MIKYSFISQIGPITLFSKNEKIIKIVLKSAEMKSDVPDSAIIKAEKQILEYFDHKIENFDFPILLEETEFTKKVLLTMSEIPYGETWSYSELAKEAGYNKADRAVGTVCKNNPLPLIIPCHRVIKKNGEIGNFNGGVELKQFLLNHEKKPF